jgi:hypothetical protein
MSLHSHEIALEESGEPIPRDEFSRVLAELQRERVERLGLVLERTLSVDETALLLKKNPQEIERYIVEKQIVSLQLGQAGTFIPSWQFERTSKGSESLMVSEKVLHLWSLWGTEQDVIGFCSFMTLIPNYRGSGQTPLELISAPEVEPIMWYEIVNGIMNFGSE